MYSSLFTLIFCHMNGTLCGERTGAHHVKIRSVWRRIQTQNTYFHGDYRLRCLLWVLSDWTSLSRCYLAPLYPNYSLQSVLKEFLLVVHWLRTNRVELRSGTARLPPFINEKLIVQQRCSRTRSVRESRVGFYQLRTNVFIFSVRTSFLGESSYFTVLGSAVMFSRSSRWRDCSRSVGRKDKVKRIVGFKSAPLDFLSFHKEGIY